MWSDGSDACLKCTICVSQCPVVAVNPSFPGPKRLGPEWYRMAESGQGEPLDHVDDCTFCQVCETACPVDVPIAHLIAEQKQRVAKTWTLNVRDALLARPHRVGRFSGVGQVPRIVRRLGHISQHVKLPTRRLEFGQSLGESLGPSRGTAALYADCYTAAYDEGLLQRARALLELWGYSVVTLPKTRGCCGAAAYAAGKPELARTIGADMKRELDKGLAGVDVLVTLNATCDGTLREEWPRYYGLRLDLPVVPFYDVADEAPQAFWTRLRSVDHGDVRLVTHSTCRGKGAVGDGSLYQLALRAGLQDVEQSEAVCCGAGGSYAFKNEHEVTATRLVAHLADQAQRFHSTGMITDSGTCAIHIEQATNVLVRHPAWWLYEWYVQYLKGGLS